ncbi:hypothetical protein [Streptomyces boninensis]|uniref:hypothetical protein n=1 Tax=Streptomyces boninensis TaxID=2039455 RepID=UPI003B21152A
MLASVVPGGEAQDLARWELGQPIGERPRQEPLGRAGRVTRPHHADGRIGGGLGGLLAGTKVGIKTAGTTAKNVMKAADPVAKVIDKPIMAAATKLGVSRGAALTATEVTQATAQVAWTAPTAINAYQTSTGRYDAATWGTGVGNIATGSGGGKAGWVTAFGSAAGLTAWELTD